MQHTKSILSCLSNELLINGFISKLLSQFSCDDLKLEEKIKEWIQK